MTIRYIAATGSNTAPYGTWATAATSLTTVTALMGAGDISYVSNTFSQTFNASPVIAIAGTVTNPAMLISTNDTTNNPPTTVAPGALLAGGAGAYTITLTGHCYVYGVEFDSGTSGAAKIVIDNPGTYTTHLESCILKVLSTAATSGSITLSGASLQNTIRTTNCTFQLGNNASQTILNACGWTDIGGKYLHTTTQPTAVFGDSAGFGANWHIGCDFSDITTTIVGAMTYTKQIFFEQCQLASGVTVMATQGSPAGAAEVWMTDCAFGNVQYAFAHYNYYGNTVAQTAIYENEQGTGDGAYYDLTKDAICWTVTGVNGTLVEPYCSPWISAYNEATSPLSLSLEIARNGSATAYNNDQVWAEFMAKITTAVTLGTLDNSDRRGLVAAAAAQANSSKTISNWTGLGGTYWLGTLAPASTITPAVIGDLKARVCVAGANVVYVNPRILGI